ncbi:hypothetical protein [Mucilaginibacter lacusdianchii]|uniref:hypothetical protein n=1 Tax=Mucilaginibacter lacusdianchii TaxID=2684211 RepID=UPI00131B74A5|nr:hypothetical protein [Mucilaginibacter sp. JXJ CY 39]
MNIEFLTSECREAARHDEVFGLCDDQNNTKAYSDTEHPDQWIATILNPDHVAVVFTPLDHCIKAFKEGTKDEESLCDGMLTTALCLYLVELKDRMHAGWQQKSTDQLVNTIQLLRANHDLAPFRYKKAYQCNKRFLSFKVIDNEENLRFFRTYGFRMDKQGEIPVK